MPDQNQSRIVVAVPVSARETCDEFRSEVDEIVCAFTPEHFQGVGLWYEDFSPTTDEEVRELLERARKELSASSDEESARQAGEARENLTGAP